jgi:hypothetical protein
VAVCLLAAAGCRRTSAEDPAPASEIELTSAEVTTNENEASDMVNISEGYAQDPNNAANKSGGLRGNCTTVTKTATPNDSTLVISFNGQTCNDGKKRSGKIYLKFSSISGSSFRTHNGNLTVTTGTGADQYKVNDANVDGTITYTRTNFGTLNPTLRVVTSLTITTAGGRGVTYQADRTSTLTAGGATFFNPFDDIWLVSGTASGVNGRGLSWSTTINQAKLLRVDRACRFLTAGEFTLLVANQPSVTIDYGTGACDNQATFTINGVTKAFSLR